MGNAAASERRFVKRDESFGSKSPLRTARIRQENGGGGQQQQHSHRQQQQQNGSGGGTPPVKSPLLPPQNGTFGGGEPLPPPPPAPPAERNGHLRQHRFSQLSQRSHSLEQSVNGTHSPSSSRSSSSNTSYLSSMLLNGGGGAGDRNAAAAASSCLRQSVEPLFAISGDLTPHQIGLVKRTWKQALKAAGNDETELACRLLLRVFQMDPRTLVYFSLKDVPLNEFAIRSSPIFMSHVKAFEPTLVHVMNHLTNATTLSKHLQQLGGRHVNYTGVTYKCSYWKCFTQSLIDVLFPDNKGGSSSDELHDALAVLGDFCVEQMRIGYRIEYKLQCEAERYQAQVQQRRRRRDLSMQRDMQAHHHVHAHHPPRRN